MFHSPHPRPTISHPSHTHVAPISHLQRAFSVIGGDHLGVLRLLPQWGLVHIGTQHLQPQHTPTCVSTSMQHISTTLYPNSVWAAQFGHLQLAHTMKTSKSIFRTSIHTHIHTSWLCDSVVQARTHRMMFSAGTHIYTATVRSRI